MRSITLLLLLVLAGCQSSREETFSDEVVCDARASDSGRCSPGKYDD